MCADRGRRRAKSNTVCECSWLNFVIFHLLAKLLTVVPYRPSCIQHPLQVNRKLAVAIHWHLSQLRLCRWVHYSRTKWTTHHTIRFNRKSHHFCISSSNLPTTKPYVFHANAFDVFCKSSKLYFLLVTIKAATAVINAAHSTVISTIYTDKLSTTATDSCTIGRYRSHQHCTGE